MAMLLFKSGDYAFTFDLKSGYHHVYIHEKHWTYLGFQWQFGSKLQYFVFRVLPFGLATACYTCMFTKLLRPLVRYWRQQGILVILYLDDGMVVEEGETKARETSLIVQRDLDRAGFITNIAKCHWEPSTSCTWLGFDINLMAGKVAVTPCKVERLKAQLKGACSQPGISECQAAG